MKTLRASDIGTYMYCHRAWWYRVHGQESINHTELAAGLELHRRHGRRVLVAGLIRVVAFILLLSACALITFFGLTTFLGK